MIYLGYWQLFRQKILGQNLDFYALAKQSTTYAGKIFHRKSVFNRYHSGNFR